LEVMESLHQTYPDTKIYAIYINRINEFKKNAPSTDWDGTYQHATK
jgi:hypothetical protein